MNVNKGSDEYRQKFDSLQAEYEKQRDELDDLRGKYDRSILRKQKERAMKQLGEAEAKVQKLETLLAARENEVGQLQSLAHSSKYTNINLNFSNRMFRSFGRSRPCPYSLSSQRRATRSATSAPSPSQR